jgi:hypothetical protein
VRFKPNGSFDGSFGDHGVFRTGFGSPTSGGNFVTMQGDKILAGGYAGTSNVNYDWAMVRLEQSYVLPPTLLKDLHPSCQAGVNYATGVISTGSSTVVQQSSLIGLDRRAAMEFSIGNFPDGLDIVSATLDLHLTSYTHGTAGYPLLSVYGYAGNGSISLSDAVPSGSVIGQYSVNALGDISIPLNLAFIQSMLATSNYIGLTIIADDNGQQAAWSSYSYPPTLSLEYRAIGGDANKDGKVSFSDYLILESNFGRTGKAWSDGDFDGDGKVGFADYLRLEASFGKSVPEPATVSMLGLVFLAFVKRGNRQP